MRNYIFLLLILLPLFTFSQTTVKGKVVNTDTGEALIGANIFVGNSNKGTSTDIEGNFSLELPEDVGETPSLSIQYIGYLPNTIDLNVNQEIITLMVNLKSDDLQLQTVIVTANKRAQSSQSVPMSITTRTPQQLMRSGAREFRDFASGIPNLSFDTQGAGLYGRFDNGISVRGISGRHTTSMYLDETPLPENIDPRLVDIGRVEVLKGPQGTLYGSRNMGGAVKVITNQPNVRQLEGSVDLSYATVKEGDTDYAVQGIFNIPLNKKLAFRGAAFYDYESGIFDRKIDTNANVLNSGSSFQVMTLDNEPFTIATDGCPGCDFSDQENIDDKRNYGFHASLGYYPTKNISIVPKIMMQKSSGDGYDFAEGAVGNFEQISVTGVPEYFQDDWKHYSLTSTFDFNKGKLISSTSFLDRNILEIDDDGESLSWGFEIYDGDENLDYFAGNISKINNTTQFNQEIRYQSNLGGKLDFTLGAFYLLGKEKEDWYSGTQGAGSYISLFVYEDAEFAEYVEDEQPAFYEFGGLYDNQEIAFFGEVYYNISNRLKATFGLRYFDATLSLDTYETGFIVDDEYFEVIGDVREKGVNPKFNLTYQIDPNKLIYGTISKGYRLGDLNEIVPDVFCGEDLSDLPDGKHPRTFESDFLWNYELGFKGTWAGGKLTTNAAVFYNDWQNLQQTRTLDCGYSFVSNVGSAHTAGLEFELRAKASRQLEIGTGFGILDARIDEGGPNLEAEAGDRILFTPAFTANANAQYSIDLNEKTSLYFYADIQHVGERLNTFAPEDADEAHRIFPAYSIVNSRVGVQFSKYEFSLFANNLTNTAANFGDIFSVAVDVPGRPRYATNRPITIGLQGRVYF